MPGGSLSSVGSRGHVRRDGGSGRSDLTQPMPTLQFRGEPSGKWILALPADTSWDRDKPSPRGPARIADLWAE